MPQHDGHSYDLGEFHPPCIPLMQGPGVFYSLNHLRSRAGCSNRVTPPLSAATRRWPAFYRAA